MARKGQFKKGGGRVGSASHHKSRSRKRHTTAIVHAPRTATATRTRYVTRATPKRHHKRRSAAGGGIKMSHLAIAAAGLAYVTSDKNGIAAVKEYGAKIPGAATFGTPAAIGLAALAVDRFVKKNRYLKLLGYAGLVLAATKLGEQGSDFKFLGDSSSDVGDYDIGDISNDDY